jgi:hypothetical protein
MRERGVSSTLAVLEYLILGKLIVTVPEFRIAILLTAIA